MNKIILCGNITKDIETRTTANNTEISNGTIAVSRTFKNAEGNYDADYINFKIFKPNDYHKNIKKGTRILIEGELRQSVYEDKNNQKRVSYEVIVNRLESFTKKEKNEYEEIHSKTEYDDKSVHLTESELPF